MANKLKLVSCPCVYLGGNRPSDIDKLIEDAALGDEDDIDCLSDDESSSDEDKNESAKPDAKRAKKITPEMRAARRELAELRDDPRCKIDFSRHFGTFYSCHCILCDPPRDQFMDDGPRGFCIVCGDDMERDDEDDERDDEDDERDDEDDEDDEGDSYSPLLDDICYNCIYDACENGICRTCLSALDANKKCAGR